MKHLDLINAPLLPSLLRFTFPILCAILLQTAYGTVDLMIVGHYASVNDLSAVTIGSQVMQSITSFVTGLAMGTTILIGKTIGSADKKKTSEVVEVSILLFTVIALILTLFLVVCHPQIALLMKTPPESLVQTKSYLLTCGMGSIFIVYYNVIASVFRGIGDSKTPLTAVFIAAVVNILLDFLFVAIFQLGASGAAYATIIAQATSVFICYIFLTKRELPFQIQKKFIVYRKETAALIFKLGFPIALQSVLVSISFLAITAIVNDFGVHASAGVGIVEKITGLVMVVPLAFMQSLSAFTAQNMGANQVTRGKQALFYGMTLSLAFGICTAYLCAFHGTLFTQFFVQDAPQTTEAALLYLKSYAFDCVFVAIMFCFSGYFNGCGNTTFVMLQAVLGACFVRIPLALALSQLPETSLFIIGLATPASTFLQIILCVFYYLFQNRKNNT